MLAINFCQILLWSFGDKLWGHGNSAVRLGTVGTYDNVADFAKASAFESDLEMGTRAYER